MCEQNIPIQLTPIVRLTKDAIAAIRAGELAAMSPDPVTAGIAGVSNPHEARVLVDIYYTTQEMRKRLANQIGALERNADTGESHLYADFILNQVETWEANAASFLSLFAAGHQIYPWLAAVHGIGPILSAGLIAHLDKGQVPPTVGSWWRYAGLDPTQRWLKKDELQALWDQQTGDVEARIRAISRIIGRRADTVIRDATIDFRTGKSKSLTKTGAIKSLARIPFSRPLKTLCWKISDQFVKLGNREDAFYAVQYRKNKARQVEMNENGLRRKMAAETLANIPNHAQKAIYAKGKIPDGRIDLIARRQTVKLFLSHLHEIWWRLDHDGQDPPKPFSISMQGHAHYIPPPYLHVFDFKKPLNE